MGERIKEGYLYKSPDVTKHIHNPKKWQRKWLSLDSTGDLYIYDSDKSGKPGGVLHIWQCTALFDPKSKGISHSFCIGLEMKEYTSYLKADSATTFNEWLKMLKGFAKRCELEETAESSTPRRQTAFSEQLSSSVQPRHFSSSLHAKFRSKEGYMSKTGGNNKGWKERYFILSQAKLSYFKNEKSTQTDALGIIDLHDCSEVTKTTGKKGYGFDLKTPSRVFNFSTESEADLVEWMVTISHNMKLIEDSKATSVTLDTVPEGKDRSSRTFSDISNTSLEKSLGGSSEEKFGLQATDSPKLQREEHKEEVESKETSNESQQDKDVLLLLEAEVEALRSKVSSLEGDLRSSTSVNSQLQDQMVQERRSKDKLIKELEGEKEDLASQVDVLTKTKEELETINDSIQAQLDEQQDKAQATEDELGVLRQELEESQANSNMFEEELSDTQSKLAEIEKVARNLEEALRKRGDSEPPPELSNLRSLNLSYKAKMAEDQLSRSLGTPAATPSTTPTSTVDPEMSLEISKLRENISKLETERNSLKEQLAKAAATSLSPAGDGTKVHEKEKPSSTAPTSDQAAAAESLVHEERLKWQVEVAKVRRELEGKLEEEREGRKKERDALRHEVQRLEEELGKGKSIRGQLEKAQQRVTQLEGEVKAASERASQLLVEKEKALADLKTIRKVNKRLSEGEVVRSASRASMSSMGSLDRGGTSPLPQSLEEGSLRLVEAERRNYELQNQLSAVEKERDQLKQQIEELLSQAPSRSAAVPIPSPALNFFGKTTASIGTSGNEQAVGGHAQAPPTKTMRNGWATASLAEKPPPKPKKPPKELVDQFSLSTSSDSRPPVKRQPLSFDEGTNEAPPSIRSRTKTMFQTFFARR